MTLDLVLSQMLTFKEAIPANSNTQIASSDWSQLTFKENCMAELSPAPYNPYKIMIAHLQ